MCLPAVGSPTHAARRRNAAGFTYLTILFVVAFMGVGLALTGEVWHTAAMREREVELLNVGNQYRKAIGRYYLSGPAIYPRTLAELLHDPRKPGVERYLRRLYPDPLTGSPEWGIVKAPDGGIMGVYSLAEDKPLKSANFRERDKGFETAERYSDWKFVYVPPTVPGKPGVKPPASTIPGTPGALGQPPAVSAPTFPMFPIAPASPASPSGPISPVTPVAPQAPPSPVTPAQR